MGKLWKNCEKIVWKNMWKRIVWESVENDNTWEKCGKVVKKIV